jgi:hypothetical protein
MTMNRDLRSLPAAVNHWGNLLLYTGDNAADGYANERSCHLGGLVRNATIIISAETNPINIQGVPFEVGINAPAECGS